MKARLYWKFVHTLWRHDTSV